jgi:hypothetical protein
MILVTLMMEVIRSPETSYLKEPHGVISQTTEFFIVTAVKKVKSYIALTGWVL